MSVLSMLGISTAQAATAGSTVHQQGGFMSVLPMLVIFIAVFYFLLIRPQTKRAKEQRELLDGLSIGDEVLTAGGVIGRIVKLRDNYIVLSICKDIEMTFQKNAVASVLPKGTMDSIG